MDDKAKIVIWGVLSGIVSNVIYGIITIFAKFVKFDYKVVILLSIASAMLAVLLYTIKLCKILRRLGFLRIHEEAEETIEASLKEVEKSFCWIGASANYVLSTPAYRNNYIKPKGEKVKFEFITLDPECKIALSEQMKWQGNSGNDLPKRINESIDHIEDLHKDKVNISWKGYSTIPTFRVVIIDEKKVLVSFYDEGKRGPDCKQLALKADGLIGKWFVQFFNKSQILANYTQIERDICRLLYKKANIHQEELATKLKELYPDESEERLKQIVNDIFTLQS